MNSNKKKNVGNYESSSSNDAMEGEADDMDDVDCLQVLYKHEKRTTKDTFD
jgi:hypothetical protein